MTFSCLSGADSRCLLLSQCNAQNVHTLKLAKVIFFCYYLYFWKFLAPWLISLTFPHVSCRKFSELVAIVAKRSQLLSACSPCTVCAYTIVSLACVELEKGADRSQIVVCVVGGLGSLVFCCYCTAMVSWTGTGLETVPLLGFGEKGELNTAGRMLECFSFYFDTACAVSEEPSCMSRDRVEGG